MKKYFFLIAWLIALVGSVYSIYLSRYLGKEPCLFCWYQRVCLFPMAILPILPLFQGKFYILPYLLPLPIIGVILSAWQTVKYSSSTLCSLSGGCEIEGSVLALVGFVLITIFLTLGIQKDNVV